MNDTKSTKNKSFVILWIMGNMKICEVLIRYSSKLEQHINNFKMMF